MHLQEHRLGGASAAVDMSVRNDGHVGVLLIRTLKAKFSKAVLVIQTSCIPDVRAMSRGPRQ